MCQTNAWLLLAPKHMRNDHDCSKQYQYFCELSRNTAVVASMACCRAYNQLKQKREEEARRREEEEDLINLLRAEEAAERDRRAAEAHRARQEALRADMLAANQAMLRLKVGCAPTVALVMMHSQIQT